MTLDVRPLAPNLNFGARIVGLTRAMTDKSAIRDEISTMFEREGMIVFDEVEPSNEMQLAISSIFGPLKEHPVKTLARVDADAMPGVIELRSDPSNGGIVEFGGRRVSHWLPWHFDHCYNDELNRAGVLRGKVLTDAGGLTGFLDGVELYRLFSPELLTRIENAEIIYTLNTQYSTQRFGIPDDLKIIRPKPLSDEYLRQASAMPRALHPAVWTRSSGEKVLHVSPYMAQGILGQEDAEGDELLRAVCAEIERLAPRCSYHHKWQANQMAIWDNWRMLHAVSGHDSTLERVMYRTTIKGDYGFGRFENNGVGGKILQDTMV